LSALPSEAGKRPAALALRGLRKQFGGLTCIDELTLTVEEAERRAVIGPNGAGKTTLFNLITGMIPPTAGEISLFGRSVTRLPPYRRTALGLGRTYQVTNLFPRLTVEQNAVLALHGLRRSKFDMLRRWKKNRGVARDAAQALERFGLAARAQVPVRELSHGEQRQLEVAVALATRPRVLLLDEPGAGLSPGERVAMAAIIRSLPSTLTVLLIEHDMDMALGLVDQVTVLHNGRTIAEGPVREIQGNPAVQEIYLGTAAHA
jgi:branched-chain amino acid transport system ATP-binding protein